MFALIHILSDASKLSSLQLWLLWYLHIVLTQGDTPGPWRITSFHQQLRTEAESHSHGLQPRGLAKKLIEAGRSLNVNKDLACSHSRHNEAFDNDACALAPRCWNLQFTAVSVPQRLPLQLLRNGWISRESAGALSSNLAFRSLMIDDELECPNPSRAAFSPEPHC